VAVVEAGQQLQLQVEGVRGPSSSSLSLAVVVVVGVAAAPDDGGDEAAGEARPVGRAGGVEHRGEAARGGLHLLGREPPDERQGTRAAEAEAAVEAAAHVSVTERQRIGVGGAVSEAAPVTCSCRAG